MIMCKIPAALDARSKAGTAGVRSCGVLIGYPQTIHGAMVVLMALMCQCHTGVHTRALHVAANIGHSSKLMRHQNALNTGHDMMLTRHQKMMLQMNPVRPANLRFPLLSKRWTQNTLVFDISKFPSAPDRNTILDAMRHIQTSSGGCIKFQEKTADSKNYVIFEKLPYLGCFSFLGMMVTGPQILNLQSGCMHKATVIHELLHALGFIHVHQRPDRDNYVTIDIGSVSKNPVKLINFIKIPAWLLEMDGIPYDYDSIMHYPQTAFSSSGKPTIITKDPSKQSTIGRTQVLSATDILSLKKMYGCETGSGIL